MASSRATGLIALGLVAAPLVAEPGSAQCTAPPNELCSGAIPFTNADLPYEVTAPLGCVNNIIDRPYFDVFYRFDCTETGTYLVDMCGSDGDTYVRVYEDGCGWMTGTELAVGDDECPGSPPSADPLVAVDLVAGESYWIEVGTWRPDPPWAPPPNSPYILRVTFEGGPPAAPALPWKGRAVLAAALVVLGGLAAGHRSPPRTSRP